MNKGNSLSILGVVRPNLYLSKALLAELRVAILAAKTEWRVLSLYSISIRLLE